MNSPTDPDRGSPSSVVIRSEPHYRHRFPDPGPLVEQAVSSDGPLHHVARCTDGLVDFVADVHPAPGKGSGGGLEHLRRIDQGLNFFIAQLDRRLNPLGTGPIKRLTVTVPGVAFLCNAIAPGIFLTCAVFVPSNQGDPDGTVTHRLREADDAVTTLVRDFRKQLRMRALAEGAVEPPSPARTEPSPPLAQGKVNHEWVGICAQALSTGGMSYVACFDEELIFSVDLFDSSDLGDFFATVSPEFRRKFYRNLGADLQALAADLGRAFDPVAADIPGRIAVDVEQGTIVYGRIDEALYVVAVSFAGDGLLSLDQRLSELTSTLRRSERGDDREQS